MGTDFQNLLSQLQQPVASQNVLLALLAAPLAALGLLPPQFHGANTQPLPPNAVSIVKHIPQLQRRILTHIAPVWATELGTADALLTQYFVPDLFSNARPAAGALARCAYAILLSTTPLTHFALACLARLAAEYPVDRLYRSVFTDTPSLDRQVADVRWSDCVRDICAVPDRVANALGDRARTDTPPALDNAAYFSAMSLRIEALVFALAGTPDAGAAARPALAYLFAKLVHVGLFPARPPTARTQPSFFAAALPSIRAHIDAPPYTALWAGLLRALPSALALQAVLASLFGALPVIEHATDGSAAVRSRVRCEAALLDGVIGAIRPEDDEQACWEVATGLVLARAWREAHARIFVCWLSGGARGAPVNTQVLSAFLDAVLSLWAAPAHVRHSLLAAHRYTTALLLLTLSCFPPRAPTVAALVTHGAFITGISAYLAHLDPAVRRCGMLAAEVVAHAAGRALDFHDWDGDAEDRAWCRELRALLSARDVDVPLAEETSEESIDVEEIASPAAAAAADTPAPARAAFAADTGADSDDSLTGYASPASSRSASPTPEELAEIEADPTLAVGRARVPRPVYLAQLGALLRAPTNVGGPRGMGTGTGAAGDAHEADRVAAALAAAEALVRRKRTYGTELAENAVDLACALLALNDSYELPGFGEQRQGALNALVTCAPEQAAPTLIQEFFKNQYSVEQRFVALNALALGARELAGLPVAEPRVPAERTAFPSKTLPAALHRKYLSADTDVVPRLVDSISRLALDKENAAAADAPAIVRERRLRLATPRRSAGITELPPSSSSSLNPYAAPTPSFPLSTPSGPRYTAVAASSFIMPLIHAFWACLQSAHAREARTTGLPGRARFHGAGTGLVLSAPVLAQLLRTLAVLVHAAQAAPEWLAVVAPAALELALAVGTRRVAHGDDDAGDDDDDAGGAADPAAARGGKEASVQAAALEVALVVLNGALEIDGGRILGLEHTALVLGLGEWAGAVFAALEKGVRAPGGGGVHAARLSRAAAGVLLKVDELTGRWSRSMLDTR